MPPSVESIPQSPVGLVLSQQAHCASAAPTAYTPPWPEWPLSMTPMGSAVQQDPVEDGTKDTR